MRKLEHGSFEIKLVQHNGNKLPVRGKIDNNEPKKIKVNSRR